MIVKNLVIQHAKQRKSALTRGNRPTSYLWGNEEIEGLLADRH